MDITYHYISTKTRKTLANADTYEVAKNYGAEVEVFILSVIFIVFVQIIFQMTDSICSLSLNLFRYVLFQPFPIAK